MRWFAKKKKTVFLPCAVAPALKPLCSPGLWGSERQLHWYVFGCHICIRVISGHICMRSKGLIHPLSVVFLINLAALFLYLRKNVSNWITWGVCFVFVCDNLSIWIFICLNIIPGCRWDEYLVVCLLAKSPIWHRQTFWHVKTVQVDFSQMKWPLQLIKKKYQVVTMSTFVTCAFSSTALFGSD